MENYLNWTDDQIEDLINNVYNGVVTREALPTDLYEAILDRLEGGLLAGFGGSGMIEKYDALNVNLKKNLSIFSAAKTFQQINDMSNFLFDASGQKNSISFVKKAAKEIFDTYNNNWLETEVATATSQTQSAVQWKEIEANSDVLGLLKFQIVGDGRTRPTHRAYDNIVRPVNDSFWNEHYTPLDWFCRCIVIQLESGSEEVTDLSKLDLERPSPLFRMNAGKDEIIFDEKVHPYFKVDQRYKALKSENFGL